MVQGQACSEEFIELCHLLSQHYEIYCINVLSRSLYGEKAMKEPERTNEMAGVYARHCVELAKDLGVRSVDLWSKMQETEGWQKKFLRFVIFYRISIKTYC